MDKPELCGAQRRKHMALYFWSDILYIHGCFVMLHFYGITFNLIDDTVTKQRMNDFSKSRIIIPCVILLRQLWHWIQSRKPWEEQNFVGEKEYGWDDQQPRQSILWQ